jgi:malate dehydrogenase (oxaloacetate-decarboxylating)(NADP+)
MNGACAAGIRICEMCKAAGVVDVTMCDTKGMIRKDRTDLNAFKAKHAVETQAKTLKEALVGADVFIGVSAANVLTGDDVKTMGVFPAIFAMANPDPEIAPAEVAKALEGRRYIMVTGRSDYPNQINNVLGFPYLFRGALDVRATTINKEMKVAAANALAALAQQPVPEDIKALYPNEELEFGDGYIIPKPFDRRLFVEVSLAVAEAAVKTGVGKLKVDLVGRGKILVKGRGTFRKLARICGGSFGIRLSLLKRLFPRLVGLEYVLGRPSVFLQDLGSFRYFFHTHIIFPFG